MIPLTQKTSSNGDVNSLTYTIIPELTDANYTNSVAFLKQYTNYLDIIQSFTDSVDRCIRYNTALNSNEVVNNAVDIFTEVNTNAAKLDNQFLLLWLSKYNRSISAIKELALSKTGKDGIYGELSDSIGLLGNSSYMLTDSVIPYNDIESSAYPAPITYPANLANKIRPNSAAVAVNLSKLTSTMFRQNIINIQFVYATSKEPHGSNLITDIVSYSRTRGYIGGVVTQLQKDFATIFKLIGFFCNINDHTGYNPQNYTLNQAALIGNLYFTMLVQNNAINIDLLGKKIKETRSSLTIASSLVSQ